MITLILIIGTTLLIAVFALVGILTLAFRPRVLDKVLISLVGLSAGALMGGAFLHLLPEAVEKAEGDDIFIFSLLAFILFFVIEKLFHWRHCHKGECEVHTFGYMNLVGDSMHNLIDGLVIATSFSVDLRLGFATFFAIALHEIPQEIGDFGVLVYAGFKKSTALVLNFSVALFVVIGGIVGFFIAGYVGQASAILLPFAAGGFIYVAASDLLPEIRKETNLRKSLTSFMFFLAGVLLMYLVKFIGEG